MLPSYAGDSIANLAASIARACGADGSSLAASLSPRHQRLLDQPKSTWWRKWMAYLLLISVMS